MTLTPERAAKVAATLDALVNDARAARAAPDLDAIRKALNSVWFAVHRAQETINDAERETRAEALKHVEGTAA